MPTNFCYDYLSASKGPMRILVIFAHPLDDGYGAALRDTVVGTLKARGHMVDLCELYKEQFDPVLSVQERRIYKDTSANFKTVSDHVQRLRQAEGVIFVFPSWWYGMPAILKGYFDRVWLPGVAFELGRKPLSHCSVALACLVLLQQPVHLRGSHASTWVTWRVAQAGV